ncbi:MAG: hypothetical protein QQN63_00675 [Nitrosopumilus sp.]
MRLSTIVNNLHLSVELSKEDKVIIDTFDRDNRLIQWSIGDIQGVAEELGGEYSDIEAQEVLYSIERTHDASIGINWEVIRAWIELND